VPVVGFGDYRDRVDPDTLGDPYLLDEAGLIGEPFG
jgi:hypothetical protein